MIKWSLGEGLYELSLRRAWQSQGMAGLNCTDLYIGRKPLFKENLCSLLS